MLFVWDEGKSRVNRRKHGISFETALRVFEDPRAVSYVDRVMDGEERWHTVGEENGEETIRIISARKASPGERDLYDSSD